MHRVTITTCRMQSCSPRWPARTRISGRVIRRSYSHGSREFRRRAMRSGIAGVAAGRRACALAEHFAVVHATDVAPEQIAAARTSSARAVFRRSCRTQWSRRGISGPGDGRAGTALVRFDGVLRGGRARRAPRRAAGRAGTIHGRNSWTSELDRRFFEFYSRGGRAVLAAGAPARRGRLQARCRFPSRKSRRRNLASSSTGISISSRATRAAGRPQRVIDRRWARIPCRCLRESISAAWPANGASVPIRMPIGLRVGRLRSGS